MILKNLIISVFKIIKNKHYFYDNYLSKTKCYLKYFQKIKIKQININICI